MPTGRRGKKTDKELYEANFDSIRANMDGEDINLIVSMGEVNAALYVPTEEGEKRITIVIPRNAFMHMLISLYRRSNARKKNP